MTVRCEGCRTILGTQVGHLTFRSHEGRVWIGDTWVAWCPKCRTLREPMPGRADLAGEIDATLWQTAHCGDGRDDGKGCGQVLGRRIGRYFQLMYRRAVWVGRLEALTCERCGTDYEPEKDAEAEARILGPRETWAA